MFLINLICILALISPLGSFARLVPIPKEFERGFFKPKEELYSLNKGLIERGGDVRNSCGQPDAYNVYKFLLRADSPIGEFNYLVVHYDATRKLPVAVTAIHDSLNQIQNVDRINNFRQIDCPELQGKQISCSSGIKMTPVQQEKSGLISWDRGHLVPVQPFRWSFQAMDRTFYCVNIGPQDPWTNQGPYNDIENLAHAKLASYPAYVMTGVCSDDNEIDGVTEAGFIVPNCWWKSICYKEPSDGQTKVVSFIGNNTIIDYHNNGPDKDERRASTRKPRAQQEVINLMVRESMIGEAWLHAEQNLLEERNSVNPDELPTASQCFNTRGIDPETESEWEFKFEADMHSYEFDDMF